jgi:iron complex transport system permease protein
MRPWLLGLFCVAVLAWGLLVGGAALSPQQVGQALINPPGWSSASSVTGSIVWQLRIPRMISAFLVGAALALAGTISQAIFRNPLADPFVVGSSAGASCFVSLAMTLNIVYIAPGLLATPWFAFIGAVLVTLLVMLLGRRQGAMPVNTMLLAGIAANYFFSSIGILIALVGRDVLHRSLLWSLEGFAGANWISVLTMLPYLVVGVVALAILAKPLNLILMGEENAIGMGLAVSRFKFLLVVVMGLLTGAAVAVSGIIGFVGLVVPHLARMWVGASHRRLLPISFLGGGLLLMASDNLARSVVPGYELPVSVITALLGVPFFIYLLRKK